VDEAERAAEFGRFLDGIEVVERRRMPDGEVRSLIRITDPIGEMRASCLVRTADDQLHYDLEVYAREAFGVTNEGYRAALAEADERAFRDEWRLDEARGDAPRPAAVEGWLHEGVRAMVGGETGDSKSGFALSLALSLASGRPLGGVAEFAVRRPYRVVLLQAENSEATQGARLRANLSAYGLAAEPDGFVMPPQVYDLNLQAKGNGRARLEGLLDRTGAEWLILDPLYKMIGAARMENAMGEGVEILDWLEGLHPRFGVGVVTTCMANPGPRTIRYVRGDAAQGYWLETYIGLRTRRVEVSGHDRNSGAEWRDLTARVEAKRDPLLEKHEIRMKGFGHWELIAGSASADGAAARDSDLARVRAYVEENPDASVRAVADGLGLSRSTAHRHLRAIRDLADST
jgi:AAA domain/IclR helix-turn-helix domain